MDILVQQSTTNTLSNEKSTVYSPLWLEVPFWQHSQITLLHLSICVAAKHKAWKSKTTWWSYFLLPTLLSRKEVGLWIQKHKGDHTAKCWFKGVISLYYCPVHSCFCLNHATAVSLPTTTNIRWLARGKALKLELSESYPQRRLPIYKPLTEGMVRRLRDHTAVLLVEKNSRHLLLIIYYVSLHETWFSTVFDSAKPGNGEM